MTFDPSVGPPEPEPLETPTRPVVAEPLPRKKGWGCGVWALIAVAAFFCMTTFLLFLAFVGMAATRGDIGGTALQPRHKGLIERTLQGEGDNKVLLIEVTGVIGEMEEEGLFSTGPGAVQSVRDALLAAREDDAVQAVVLSVDSPGGGVTASDVIHREIVSFREETGVPVVALFGDVAASGGYYVASGADYIVAHPTTITGSIGVIMPLLGAKDLLQKIGVEIRPIKSGEMKDSGAFYRDLTVEDRAYLQNIVDQLHNRFVDLVFEGMQRRDVKITRDQLLTYCDGRVLTGPQAKELGFVDEIGYSDDAFSAACARADISPDNTKLVTYHHKPGLLELFLARAVAPSPRGVTIDIDALKGKQTPRFMYLWTVGD